MRALLALAASLLLPLAAAGAQPAGGTRYVPADFLESQRDSDRYDSWIAESLEGMQEPSLLGSPLPSELLRRFRLLVRVNHRGSMAVRVDQRRAGGARVRAVELSGGRSPGIIREQIYDIDRDDVRELERALRLAGLRRMTALTPAIPFDPDGELCIPSRQFFFELVEAPGSRFVTRDDCEVTPRLRRLLETLQPLHAR